jgi:hypothetical protein
MNSWKIVIYSQDGSSREIPLDHQYANEQEAESEAEDIVDQEYTGDDDGWSLIQVDDTSLTPSEYAYSKSCTNNSVYFD